MNASPDAEDHAAPPVRVVLADDHPAMLALAASALAGFCTVVESVADGLELLAAAKRSDPDLIVLDMTMPQLNGLDAARELRHCRPEMKLVFLSVHEDADFARAAFAAGGLGYVVKSRLAWDLAPAIRAALAGRRFLSPTLHLDEAA